MISLRIEILFKHRNKLRILVAQQKSPSYLRLSLLTHEDSNLDKQNQNLMCYHYTMGHALGSGCKNNLFILFSKMNYCLSGIFLTLTSALILTSTSTSTSTLIFASPYLYLMDYIQSVKNLFLYYKTLGEKAIAQLEPGQLVFQFNEDSNSIATVVKHLSGNMISRWTDFLTSDGEKPFRQRDHEFENESLNQTQIMELWNQGWKTLFDTLDQLNQDDLDKIIYIRNEGHTVMEAINRQLAHYPYHVGQIVYIAKALKSGPWNTLSIARNQSKTYNNNKFAKEKGIRNFTEEELNNLNK